MQHVYHSPDACVDFYIQAGDLLAEDLHLLRQIDTPIMFFPKNNLVMRAAL